MVTTLEAEMETSSVHRTRKLGALLSEYLVLFFCRSKAAMIEIICHCGVLRNGLQKVLHETSMSKYFLNEEN